MTFRSLARRTMPVSLAALIAVLIVSGAEAQSQFPPPAGPVTFCGQQAAPAAVSYQLVVDGAAPEAVTMAAPVAACPVGATHSFTLAAARFAIGTHTVKVLPTNAFGTTTISAVYTVTVGIQPGTFTITAVIPGE